MSLVLAVASTIILGLQQLNFWTGLAFSFVAVGTLISAEYYLLKTPAADVALDELDPFFERLHGVWTNTSERPPATPAGRRDPVNEHPHLPPIGRRDDLAAAL